jgi:hypothetical protein
MEIAGIVTLTGSLRSLGSAKTRLRRVVERPLVAGVNVWKGGRWVFVPQHYANADGN